MSGVTTTLKRLLQTYGRAAVPALLLHAVLLAALLQLRFTPAVKPPDVEPVVSYLYQPPVSTQQAQPQAETGSEPVTPNAEPVTAKPSSRSLHAADSKKVEQAPADTPPVPQPGLARRSLERAATTTPAAMDQAAAASYQQFLQAQQQTKITVEKRHQQLSKDPAQQVMANLADGRQIIRTKEGCRIADPAKDGFDALMALKTVPCGDEDNSSDLLKQALEKHSKR
ncbi:hypothetical protein [Rheinheimera sp.]|uniref:hypothetical protein n=1 Tax=Rheinheimera sp. TaxID=1869214 RepID=UPI00273382ED|nr:hypothetical protein [Rheinheimera sp.]MDP2714126.1 hypothetical protein [Rheinheimera sp.]